LENGRVVKPSDVMEDRLLAEGFLINYVPNSSYIGSVVNNKKYETYFKENQSENINLNLIYHSSDSLDIFNDPDYLHFMTKFGESATHVID
jgi:hypothetical protein